MTSRMARQTPSWRLWLDPETAEIWTKPGGLEFNADDPKKVLGTLGEQFLVLMCDGAVRFLNSDIDDETLTQSDPAERRKCRRNRITMLST